VIAIVGGGRMGAGLASALGAGGERVLLWSRREATGAVEGAVAGAGTIILAVPDDAIAEVAAGLAHAGTISRDQVVLHLSGLHDRSILEPLAASGAALGSLHPLQSIADPATAAARWRGAYAAVEGDPVAIAEADRVAGLLGLIAVRLPPGAKARYHAGAVVAANYVVALAGVAERFAVEAGIDPALAARMYLPMISGAAANLREAPPAEALTGPVRRGDVETIRRHLGVLPEEDRRLYAMLGLETLRLARLAGLDAERAAEVERVLRKASGY